MSYKNNIVTVNKIKYGKHYVVKFDNLYGLSIIEENVGEGPRFNIAVIRFYDELNDSYELDYNNGITNKDIRTNNEKTIEQLCKLVQKLPPKNKKVSNI